MSQAVSSMPLSMSLPSNVLRKTLDQPVASVSPKPTVALPSASARKVKIRSALLKLKRIPGRQISQAVPARRRVLRIANFVVEDETEAEFALPEGKLSILVEQGLKGLKGILVSPPSASVAPAKKKGFGSLGGVTLEKSKLEKVQPLQKFGAPPTADGGGGGDIGKKISHGGGDGGDDGGDDDDYFGDFDEGDDGDEGGFLRSTSIQEIFDREIVEAVLREWHKTMSDLPAGLLQACEMGLISTAQMVRYLSINARPTVSRFISRAMPQAVSRAFIGRMIADPAFLYKMLLEQTTTICCSAWWEFRHRKERIKREWDLALINVLTVSICNAAIVWTLAPCRSYGNTFRFNLENTLQKLPNNIFERSYPLREFDLQKRIHCSFYKAAELCMVGMAAGAANGALSQLLASQREGRTSLLIPPVSTSSLGYGAFLGLAGNLRYQLLYGIERVMHHHLNDIGLVIFLSTALRMINIQVGDVTRLAWLGLDVDPTDPLFKSENLLKAYNRPSEASKRASSNWFIAQKAQISGLFGGQQKSEENAQEPSPPSSSSTPRRRVAEGKITARS
uniref:Uncharacterized protein n=1 Tax=Araucaria cunninghamii TaxID=56994 RepID=A0A0D6R078_ARACU